MQATWSAGHVATPNPVSGDYLTNRNLETTRLKKSEIAIRSIIQTTL